MIRLAGFGGSSGDESPLPPPETSGRETDYTPGGGEAKKRVGRPPGSSNKQSLDKLEERLKDKLLEEMVLPIAFISPLAAANVEERAERTAKAAMRIAAKNPKVRRGIEKAIDGSDVFTLVMFPLTTAVCVMVDMGMMQPTAAPARAAGVGKLWPVVYPDEVPGEPTNGTRTGHRGLYATVA